MLAGSIPESSESLQNQAQKNWKDQRKFGQRKHVAQVLAPGISRWASYWGHDCPWSLGCTIAERVISPPVPCPLSYSLWIILWQTQRRGCLASLSFWGGRWNGQRPLSLTLGGCDGSIFVLQIFTFLSFPWALPCNIFGQWDVSRSYMNKRPEILDTMGLTLYDAAITKRATCHDEWPVSQNEQPWSWAPPADSQSHSQDGAALSHKMMAMMTINAYGCMPLNGLMQWTSPK